jgi:perosamine synthetase
VDQYHNLKIEDVINFIKNKTKFKNNKTINIKTKKIIKVVIVAHMWGRACDFSELKNLCKKRNIFILEDAAEALGSYIKKNKYKHCGSIGDIGCLSFNANKIITTGSGGSIITNNKKFYERAQYLANQAKMTHLIIFIMSVDIIIK